MKLNHEAFENAQSLILSGKVDRVSEWTDIQAKLDEDRVATKIDAETYPLWFLAVKHTTDDEQTIAYHDFLYGDFDVLHRSALINAKYRAHHLGYQAIEKAIDKLIVQIDKEADVVTEASEESFPASDPPNWRDRR